MGDAVVGVLLDKLVTLIHHEVRYVQDFAEQLVKLMEELKIMQGYLNDTSQVNENKEKETFNQLSQSLRERLYDADDIIAECDLVFIKQRQQASNSMMCFSPSIWIFHNRMGKMLAQKNREIEDVRESMKPFLVKANNQVQNQEGVIEWSQPVRYPVLINEDEIVGLDNDSRRIMEWILQADEPLTVLGIVGMGGVGKTTLAQKIYKNNIVKRHFDGYIKVVAISRKMTLEEMIKNFLRKLDMPEELLSRDIVELLYILQENVDVKYLLILDDIWSTDNEDLSWWKSLKSALPRKKNGSCVIVTTRNVQVARSMGATESRIHHLKCLSSDDSWLLFSKIAFERERGQCPNPDLERIGQDIVRQCEGLPLAIKVVGEIMLWKGHSLHKWANVSSYLKEELEIHKNKSLFSTLRLSYEDLPTYLKPCMLCFALFPKDSIIHMDKVIYWWIGEGFVTGKDDKTAYEIGEQHLAELVNRGLLLVVGKDCFERGAILCRVHDMVGKMIIDIAKQENFMSLDDMGKSLRTIKPRRITATDGIELSENFSHLRTLILRNIQERELISKLCQLKWLRVLVLEFTGDDVLEEKDDYWRGIGSFLFLTYLKIANSRLERLPNTIRNLQNLKVISLEHCLLIKTLPEQVTSLEKLTNLHTVSCQSLEYYPVGIKNLLNLEELLGFKPRCSGVGEVCCVSELEKLDKLKRLDMTINADDQIKDEYLKVLPKLKKLEYLRIIFSPESRNDEEEKQLLQEVDYNLSPCNQLQELYLCDFPGEETPAWLNPSIFPNLRFLSIEKGKMKHMHSLFFGKSGEENTEESRVWNLEALNLGCLLDLEEEWPRMNKVMPYLNKLQVYQCPKLCNVASQADRTLCEVVLCDKAKNLKKLLSNKSNVPLVFLFLFFSVFLFSMYILTREHSDNSSPLPTPPPTHN